MSLQSELRQYSTDLGKGLFLGDVGSSFSRGKRERDKIRIGLLVPFSGNDAIWGPAGQYSAMLASALVNASGGVLGREVELFGANSGGNPNDVVDRVGDLIHNHQVQALVGVHMSNVRIAIRDAFSRQIPYVYATQYEGGEVAPGLFAIGETPVEQYGNAVRWMIREMGARRWYFVGNDYVWPRKTHDVVTRLVQEAGGEVVGVDYVPLGSTDHDPVLNNLRQSMPDIVFQSLVGTDCVTFNQEFGERGLARHMMRLSGVIEENVLMGIGAENSENLFAVAGYFSSLRTAENQAFLSEYASAFGTYAPVQGGMSQATYESIFFLAALVGKSGSLDVADMMSCADDFTYEGARGAVNVRRNGTSMQCHLMRASDLDYELICSFPRV